MTKARAASRAAVCRGLGGLALLIVSGLACAPGGSREAIGPEGTATAVGGDAADTAAETLRVALFNIRELRSEKIERVDDSGVGADPQVLAAARIIRRVRPDVLVINEIDHDYDRVDEGLERVARRFAQLYLAPRSLPSAAGDPGIASGHAGDAGIEYPYAWAGPNNTGILSGIDLDGDGHVATDADRGTREHGNDSFGYGTYPGEYSIAVLSRYPILGDEARSFRGLLWKDLPGHHMPPDHLSPAAVEVFRLSSKAHQDIPVDIGGRRLHLFASHPTPPSFDGPEDRNGRRNFDEIKLWAEYLDDGATLVDDAGVAGGYGSDEPFVVLGDLNASPGDPESAGAAGVELPVYDGIAAIAQLLDHPRIRDTGDVAQSRGALGGRVSGPPGWPERSTAAWRGGVRVDYVLPSVDLAVLGGGVFWPAADEDPLGHAWAEQASDHRMVWIDLALPSPAAPADAR